MPTAGNKIGMGMADPRAELVRDVSALHGPPNLSLAPLGLRTELGASSGLLVFSRTQTLQTMHTRLQQQFVARGTVHFLMCCKKKKSLSPCLDNFNPGASSPQASSPSSRQSTRNEAIRTVQQSVS